MRMQRLGDLATHLQAELVGDPELEITGLCGVSDNLPSRLSYLGKLSQRRVALASAIPAFITLPEHRLENKACLLHADPELAMVLAAALFQPTRLTYENPTTVHPSAVVHPSARIGAGTALGAFVVIGRDVQIGAGCTLYPGVTVMDRAHLGPGCVLHPQVVVREDCVLGARVILQPGAIIGGDGYGFLERDGKHLKIPQLGQVVLEDDVEIGANTTIDRGRFTATHIGRGTKIDNLVMIAHNVQVGSQCLIVAQTGISGSTKLGDRVTLAGQVGVTGHLNVCSDVTVLGKSVIAKHVLKPGTYAGIPIRPVEQWKKAIAKLYASAKGHDEPTS
jgi:UDP-3-O-[3-hydroxymyristoyl] glucosamine N-acyltransferase